MVKIEKLTQGCSATLRNGREVLPGQLIGINELEGITVRNGTLTISIDELEIREIKSLEELETKIEDLAKAAAKELHNPTIKIDSAKTPEEIEISDTENLKQLNKILEEANTKVDSAKSIQKVTHSAKSTQTPGK